MAINKEGGESIRTSSCPEENHGSPCHGCGGNIPKIPVEQEIDGQIVSMNVPNCGLALAGLERME
jgi:hypothetical protein